MALALSVARDMIWSEQAMSRFWPTSDLTRLNGSLGEWVPVPPRLRRALVAARRAGRMTGGLFDPTVLATLEELGYRGTPLPSLTPSPSVEVWGEIRSREGMARLSCPVDLGGIGKGLALRWGGEVAERVTGNFLLNAGGDLVLRGGGPDGRGWSVGVENPLIPEAIVAALRLNGPAACATSSVARRRWRHGGQWVHHLIDPRTRQVAVSDLLAVTVVHDDPAWTEVRSKELFFAGSADIPQAAGQLAALWVDCRGKVGWTETMAPQVEWVGDGAL